jgi:non-ribosomal peptide synthetase component F
MTDKLPWGEARKIIIDQRGSGKTAPQIAKTLNISESYVWRVWRDAEYPVVAHLDRLRRKHGQGTGTMRTVMKLLTEEQRAAIYQDATDWGVGVPTVIVSILRDAYAAPEPEKMT